MSTKLVFHKGIVYDVARFPLPGTVVTVREIVVVAHEERDRTRTVGPW